MSNQLFLVKILLALAFVLFSFTAAAAEKKSSQTEYWGFQFENDLWGSKDDRFYTHGTKISYASTQAAPQWLEKMTDGLPFYHQGGKNIHGYSLGQKMFTPADTTKTELIENDRPYAGWLFLDIGIADRYRYTGGDELLNGLILTLGVVGPSSLAGKTQKEFHRLIDSDRPKGWDNQLRDELGLNVTYLRKWRRLFGLYEPRQFEISHHGGLTLGNVYSYASVGVMARWGTRLRNDIGPPSISPGFPGLPAFKAGPEYNWYFFAGAEGRAMGRNIFLDGNTFHNSYRVDKKDFVGDLQFGLAIHYKNVRVALSNLIRTREFDDQSEKTQYGAINITFYESR